MIKVIMVIHAPIVTGNLERSLMVQERLGERLRGYEFSTFVIIFTCVCFTISYLNAPQGREASIEE